MSAQTGVPSVRPSPTSRGFDRVRANVRYWRSAPNPVWLREMRQSARLTRTPFVLMGVTAAAALLLSAIGVLMAAFGTIPPATTGWVLHQVFFSIAFLVVTIAGPAVAANSIASEREGRTWEALLLTGLPPQVIARGKFLAAYTSVATWIVTMAPVGALPFLFGGVTATEVALAFVMLFFIAGLSVAFGLAVSSKMESVRAAILVTLIIAFVLVPTVYLGLGVGLGAAAHDHWKMVELAPVWLPTALVRVPFGLDYLGYLVALPSIAVAIPAWFFYEATIANLTSTSDDRSTRLRYWYVTAAGLAAVFGVILPFAVPGPAVVDAVSTATSILFAHLVFGAFVFAGDPIGPSRRVKNAWTARDTPAWRRALGPGVVRAGIAQIAVGVGCLGLILIAGVLGAAMQRRSHRELLALVLLTAYAAAFHVFVVGSTSLVRARTNSPSSARVALVVMLFLAVVAPWAVGWITGLAARTEAFILAASSPAFPVWLATKLAGSSGGSHAADAIAAAAAAAGWMLVGLATFGRAIVRCRAMIRTHDAAITAGDEFLAREDAEAAGAGESAPEPAP